MSAGGVDEGVWTTDCGAAGGGGLAGCGVAVDQRTLAPVVSAAAPAQTPEADPAAETADT